MAEPNLFRLRIVFCKQGRLALLSHLEVVRALERAIRRAGLPYAVSQGFSPHMKIAFGAALPVGVGGKDEIVDLQLVRYVDPQEALDALQRASVTDLMVKACRYIEKRDPAASVAFPVSTYRAVLSMAPCYLPVPIDIAVVRKKKEKHLRPADFLAGDICLEGSVVTFRLIARPTGSLRPDVFLKSCCRLLSGEDESLEEEFCVSNSMPDFCDAEYEEAGGCMKMDIVSLARIAQDAE